MEKLDLTGNRHNPSAEILKAIRLCLAITFIATGCRRQPAHFATPPSSAASEVPLHLAIPDQCAYTGAYMDFGEGEDDVTLEQIEAFEQAVGKHQAIIAS